MRYTFLLLLALIPLSAQNKQGIVLTQRDYEHIIQTQENIRRYNEFKEKLGLLESSGRYHITNRSGRYLGKYQFGELALSDIGYDYSPEQFLSSMYLQERALYEYLKANRRYLSRELERFVGKTINGIKITTPGLLAAAHLGGAGSVKKFLYSGEVFRDGNGTSIIKYLREFSDVEFTLTDSIEVWITNNYV